MKIGDILKQRETGVSFEFFPPRNEKAKVSLQKTVAALKSYSPLYTSMTCGAAGSSQTSTQEAVNMLLEEGGLEVMPHMTCISTHSSAIRGLLDEYRKQGIENIMALRGDIPLDTQKDLDSCDLAYAKDLVQIIKNYGHFSIGVAVYPEGHIETASLDEDLQYTKQKIDTGADFAVTQMFFNNDFFYRFIERAKGKGITIPILPGILPLTNIGKVREFASICRATLPVEIEEAMGRFSDNPAEMEKVGIDFTIKQCRDLMAKGFRRLHFFTLNRVSVMRKILEAVI